MPEVVLAQAEADALLAMEKHRTDDTLYRYPPRGEFIKVPLISPDKREHFILDVGVYGSIALKVTHQNRARSVVILVRLDIGGAPHRNPDGKTVPCPHLHVYREGYDDKWAFPVDAVNSPDVSDLSQTLDDFLRYCNVTKPPLLQNRLLA